MLCFVFRVLCFASGLKIPDVTNTKHQTPKTKYQIPNTKHPSLNKIIWIIRPIRIKGGPFDEAHPGFPTELFETVFFQLFGEHPHIDPHRAGTFACPAVGTPSGTVKGPQEMKGSHIRGILPFAHPLGFGFIHKACGAIA